jgi:hypothetical protein
VSLVKKDFGTISQVERAVAKVFTFFLVRLDLVFVGNTR